MNKIKFKKIGSSFNHDGVASAQSVCGFNSSEKFCWLSTHSNEQEDFFFYMDEAIINYGLNDNKIKYGWLLESRGYIQNTIDAILNNLDLIKQHYKYIFTCQLDLVELGEPFAYVISNARPYTKAENFHLNHTKDRLVSMLVSVNAILSGHHKRLEFLEKNKEYLSLYGRGREQQVNHVEEAMMRYLFTVTMENDYHDDYFTERLTGPMSVGTIPIYQGSKSVVEKFFDPKGVLWADEINIKGLNKFMYDEMMPSIINNFNIVKNDLPLPEEYLLKNYLDK